MSVKINEDAVGIPATPVLQCHQLALNISDQSGMRSLIEPFDWCVNAGERWAILGANGVGKTSILHALLGTQTQRNAHISYCGRNLNTLSAVAQSKLRVWTPQRYDEPFTITVLQALRSVSVHLAQSDEAQLMRCLHEFGLEQHARAWVHQLSGGERQRLTWAMAQLRITDATRVWLLDEPFSAQDIAWQRRLLMRLRDQSQAVVASVHDLNQVRAFATHVMLLCQGRVLMQGAVADVMRSEHLSAAFGVDLYVNDDGWIR